MCWYSPYGWLFVLAFLVLFITGLVLGSMNICSCFYIDVICSGASETNAISLSFDDGPAEQTAKVLDILKKHEVKAGFFCIGKNVQANPEIIRRMDNEGHFIGNHSFSHAFWFDLFSRKKMLQEMMDTNKIIFDLTGKKMKLFRPPYGVTTPVLAKAIRQTKMIAMGWSLRTLDTVANGDTKKIMKKLNKIKSGDIVLFHDHTINLLEILDTFILKMKSKEINLVRPDILVKINAYD